MKIIRKRLVQSEYVLIEQPKYPTDENNWRFQSRTYRLYIKPTASTHNDSFYVNVSRNSRIRFKLFIDLIVRQSIKYAHRWKHEIKDFEINKKTKLNCWLK